METKSAQSLRRSLGAFSLFAIGFGCTIGVAWIMLLGDFLAAAGPFGAALAFAIGGGVITLVGLCYAELSTAIPRAGGEAAYAYTLFGPRTSFAIGWFLCVQYAATAAFEAVSITWIIQKLFPQLSIGVAYPLLGYEVTYEALIIGMAAVGLMTALHWHGIDKVGKLQSVFTWTFLGICIAFFIAALSGGDTQNLAPKFASTSYDHWLMGVAWLVATSTFWLSGFQLIVQVVEERSEKTALSTVPIAIVATVVASAIFYVFVIFASSIIVDWKTLASVEFATMLAFERAFESALFAKVAMFAALIGLITTWNTVIIGATRIMLELGRNDLMPAAFSRLHRKHASPSLPILMVAICSALGVIGGRGVILPIISIGALTLALSFAFVCLAVFRVRKRSIGDGFIYRVPGGPVLVMLALVMTTAMVAFILYDGMWKAALEGEFVQPAMIAVSAITGLLFYIFRKKTSSQVADLNQVEP